MGVTRFTVYAGLAGLWIVRDERERALGLPEGFPFELPLLLQDRNFDEGPHGRLSGELVHKTDPGTMEAFAPFTTVNGKIWPSLEVHPSTYRLRIINGSNARTFRLVLMCDGQPDLDRISQIGTDHGLLRAPVGVPPEGLVLAPAERADLLVDFSDLQPGNELTLLNTASAPFDGAPYPPEHAAQVANVDGLLPYPDVMRFRVVPGTRSRTPAPRALADDFSPPTADELANATRRGRPGRTGARERDQHAHDARAHPGGPRRRRERAAHHDPRPRRFPHRPHGRALPHGGLPLRGHGDLLPDPRAL
jgi:spore coat protein A